MVSVSDLSPVVWLSGAGLNPIKAPVVSLGISVLVGYRNIFWSDFISRIASFIFKVIKSSQPN